MNWHGLCFIWLLHGGATHHDVSAVCIMANETSPLIYQYFLMFKMFQDDEALQQKLAPDNNMHS